MIRTKRGLDLPISGSPIQSIEAGQSVNSVALVGFDYPGLKPTMEVAVGDRVAAGQLIFTDKKTDGVKYTSPASGTVAAINRGARRVFESLVIDIDGDESTTFASYGADELAALPRDEAIRNLIDSGQWTSLRTRPFSKVPTPDSTPHSIFVTAIDSRPLAADPTLFINEQADAFLNGLDVLSTLTDGPVFLCASDSAELPESRNSKVRREDFRGPHPSGLVGTHIHFLDPVSMDKTVWTVGYQDVIAIGHLFTTGKLYFDRVVSLAGPSVKNPRLVRTRLGACTTELTSGELIDSAVAENRVVAGSVLDGRRAHDGLAYMGRFHNQVSVLLEGTEREFMGFIMPGVEKFSLSRLFVSSFLPKKALSLTTSTGGSERAMVPLGTYEEVMPLDILPTQLLRALLVSDFDTSIQLGCLELDEEDLALCTFACPGKYEYGPYLRQMLTTIEVES
jgi:Na+-transporting NADH:ubiquinone oxidoreductase subunit A